MFKKIKERRIEKKAKRRYQEEKIIADLREQNREKTNVELCEAYLSAYQLSSEQISLLKTQITSMVEELEAINHPIDHQEIVAELIELNEFENLKCIGKTEEIELKYASRNLLFTNEMISHVKINGKYSGGSIDLRKFNFNAGELVIESNGKYSGIDIYINSDVNVSDWTNVKMSGIIYHLGNEMLQFSSFHELPQENKIHSLRLEGKMYMSGIRIIVGYEGPINNNQGQSNRAKKRIKRAQNRLDRRK